MTIITKPLSQQEKLEKQRNVEKSMEDVSLSDSVDVEAKRTVYCYTRGKKSSSTNTCIVITVMIVTCVALALLGYYQFACFRKDVRENLRKTHMQHLRTKPQNSHQKHQPSETVRNIKPRADKSHHEFQNSDSALTSSSTSVDKYHRGSCRLPCNIQETLQKLCPRRSGSRNVPPNDVLPGQLPKEGASLVLGGIGDWRDSKEENPLVSSQVEIERSSQTETDTYGDNGTFEVTYTMDLEQETFELIQMPEISSGVYIHDFTVNRTAIIEENRCFVMVMDRNEIAPPRSFYDMIQNIKQDGYELNLDEVQHDMMIVLPELNEDQVFKEYGLFVGRLCKGKTVLKLAPVPEEIASVDDVLKNTLGNEMDLLQNFGNALIDEWDSKREKRYAKGEKMFKEISKFSINYKIVNYDIL